MYIELFVFRTWTWFKHYTLLSWSHDRRDNVENYEGRGGRYHLRC